MSLRDKSAALALFGAITLASAGAAAGGEEHGKAPVLRDDELGGAVEGASALEGRIIAPCCWTQTIDVHGSEISSELRREIRRRLKAGESADVIQEDFVKRYGARVLAVPPGNPLKDLAVILSIGFVGAGVGAAFMLVRWQRRNAAERVQ